MFNGKLLNHGPKLMSHEGARRWRNSSKQVAVLLTTCKSLWSPEPVPNSGTCYLSWSFSNSNAEVGIRKCMVGLILQTKAVVRACPALWFAGTIPVQGPRSAWCHNSFLPSHPSHESMLNTWVLKRFPISGIASYHRKCMPGQPYFPDLEKGSGLWTQ